MGLLTRLLSSVNFSKNYIQMQMTFSVHFSHLFEVQSRTINLEIIPKSLKYLMVAAESWNINKEASRLYAELLLCVCWHTEHI